MISLIHKIIKQEDTCRGCLEKQFFLYSHTHISDTRYGFFLPTLTKSLTLAGCATIQFSSDTHQC